MKVATYTLGRVAQLITHSCGQPVWAGLDQLDAEMPVLADLIPLDDLTETVAHLDGRGVHSLIPAPGGPELHRRENWHLYDRRWPALARHTCPRSNP